MEYKENNTEEMTPFSEIENEIQLGILEECIEQCQQVCNVLASVNQIITDYSGNTSVQEVTAVTFECEPKVYINDNKFYVRITSYNTVDINKIYSAWETVLERGTSKYLAGDNNDYYMKLDLVKQDIENNLSYIMSFVLPMFIGQEDGGLLLVFDLTNMRFSKNTVDFVAVNDEIDYEHEIEKQESKKLEVDNGKDDYDENDDIISNDDLLDNDDYLY